MKYRKSNTPLLSIKPNRLDSRYLNRVWIATPIEHWMWTNRIRCGYEIKIENGTRLMISVIPDFFQETKGFIEQHDQSALKFILLVDDREYSPANPWFFSVILKTLYEKLEMRDGIRRPRPTQNAKIEINPDDLQSDSSPDMRWFADKIE